jgi:hypothetical protein
MGAGSAAAARPGSDTIGGVHQSESRGMHRIVLRSYMRGKGERQDMVSFGLLRGEA